MKTKTSTILTTQNVIVERNQMNLNLNVIFVRLISCIYNVSVCLLYLVFTH